MKQFKHIKRHFFPVFFPSLFLLASAGTPGLDSWNHHREAFGSENYYLVVQYSGSPDGVLSSSTPVPFSGSLVTELGEFELHGVRRKEGSGLVYELTTSQGGFVGRVEAGKCPQFMELVPHATSFRPERLRVGTCL